MRNTIDALLINHKPVNETILKRLILVFDHVNIISPNENRFLIPEEVAKISCNSMKITLADYAPLYNGKAYEQQEKELVDKFQYAYEKGIVRVTDLRASKFYEKYWLPLRLSYDFDTANKDLLNLTQGLFEKNRDPVIENGIIRGGFIEPAGVKIYPSIPSVPDMFSKDIIDYRYDIQAFSIIGKIDRALAVCGEFDFIPIFLEPTMNKIFTKKLDIAKSNSDISLQNKFQGANGISLQKVQYLLYKISEKILPDAIIDNIPLKEFVTARNNTFHELYRMRRDLMSSISSLSEYEADTDFCTEAENFISKKFEPQLQLYDSKLYELFAKLARISFTFDFAVAGTLIGLSQALSPFEIAFYSGVSATVGSAISELPVFILKRGKKEFKNTYSYFLNFK